MYGLSTHLPVWLFWKSQQQDYIVEGLIIDEYLLSACFIPSAVLEAGDVKVISTQIYSLPLSSMAEAEVLKKQL